MKLIVIEGLDGAGKSTQLKKLSDHFSGMGIDHEFIHFPRTGAPYFGELIARFLRGEYGEAGEVDPYLVAILYAGDRKDIADDIYSWLKEGKYVLLDRYVYSNIAYQCAKMEDEKERQKLKKWIQDLEFSHFGIPIPAVNIFLDVPFEFTAGKLLSNRSGTDRDYLNGNKDIHESSLDFQKNVRQVYLKTAEEDNSLEIIECTDKTGSMSAPEDIFRKIIRLLQKKDIITC